MTDSILMNLITPSLAAFLTWVFTKRKNKAEVKSSELDNYDKNLKIYQNIIDDLKVRMDQLLASNQNLVESLRKQVESNREMLLEQERLRNLLTWESSGSREPKSVLSEREKNYP
jgi:predicted transcriptional regulator